MKRGEALAKRIIDTAHDGYRHQAESGYPPYAIMSWDDRLRWTDYLKKVAGEVLSADDVAPEDMLDKMDLLHALYLGLKGAGDRTPDYARVLQLIKQVEGTSKLVYVRDVG